MSVVEWRPSTDGLVRLPWRFASVALLGGALLAAQLRRWWWLRRNRFPRVPGWPWFGVVGDLIDPEKLCPTLEAWSRSYGAGGIFEFDLVGERILAVCDYEHLKPLLSMRPFRMTRSSKFASTGIVDLVPGLFMVEGRRWGVQRRLTAPAFSARAVQSYLPDICGTVGLLLGELDRAASEGALANVSSLMRRTTAAILVKLAFGEEVDSLRQLSAESQAVSALLSGIQTRITSPLPYWRIPGLSGPIDGMNAARRTLRQRALAILQKPEAAAQAQFLSSMLSAESDNTLSQEEVVGNLIILLVAGTDTTSTTLSWALYHLARHPDVQEEVAAEAACLASGLPLAESVGSLIWAQAVWRESLRLNSVVPTLFLEVAEPCEIDGRAVPQGTTIWAMMQESCRRSSELRDVIGDDWDAWRPRRWIVEGGAGLRSCPPFDDSMAFGHGARLCPGKLMSNTVGPLVLAEILRRFAIGEWRGGPMHRKMEFMVGPARDIELSFSARAAA